MIARRFDEPTLDEDTARRLEGICRIARGDILTMTSVAGSGHPGGSFSSIELFTVVWHGARLDPTDPDWPERDRIVVSHGHTSPGVYATLAHLGFIDRDDVKAHFRQAGSPFEGHVERSVPGVEWSTGNLGQGLSAGVGFALAARMTGIGWHTFVAMSDGEQHKGQVSEARRLAVKERLSDLTVIVDLNGIQISGRTADVMPVDVPNAFRADGWAVLEVDGHDITALHEAIARAVEDRERPWAIIAHTTIGRGVSFMEGRAEYHGRALTEEEYVRAMAELGLSPELDRYRHLREGPVRTVHRIPRANVVPVRTPEVRVHGTETRTDARSAWGEVLVALAEGDPSAPLAVLDCDLAQSVKTDGLARVRPHALVQCGVGEHNAAVVAGALSVSGVLTFWADFGVFGIDEVYNQLRLNDINDTAIKLVLTHCGLDVGEDGKTHQCLDYVGAFRNLFGWKVIVPADPNQTRHAVCSMVTMPGNVALAVGRSKIDVILDESGRPFFDEHRGFTYGRIEWVREGSGGVVLAMGTPAGEAVRAADELRREGADIAVGIVSSPLEIAEDDLARLFDRPWVLCVEDHHWQTGLFATVAANTARSGVTVRIVPHGVDGYQGSGAARDLYALAGLDAAGIIAAIRRMIG